MNPIKCLYSLAFSFLVQKMNLNLNLKYTEKPLPRFKSAPPHLWKGVQIDIEGRWLESRNKKQRAKTQPQRHYDCRENHFRQQRNPIDIVLTVGHDSFQAMNERVDSQQGPEAWRI